MNRDDISIANSYEKSKGTATEEQLLDSVRQNLKYRRESEKGSDSYEMINGWLARDLNELDLRFPGHKYSDKFLDLHGRGKNAAANKQLKEEIKKTQELAKELANETEKVIKDKIVAEKATQDELKKNIAEVKSTKKNSKTPNVSGTLKSNPVKKVSVSKVSNIQKITKAPEPDVIKELSLAKEFVKFLKVKYSSIKDVSSKYKSHENYKQGMVPVEISIDDLRSLMGMT